MMKFGELSAHLSHTIQHEETDVGLRDQIRVEIILGWMVDDDYINPNARASRNMFKCFMEKILISAMAELKVEGGKLNESP